MFNTSDSPPRSDLSSKLKNVSVAAGGVGLGYAGLKIGKAATRISDAAEKTAEKIGAAAHSVEKSTPASVYNKLKGMLSRKAKITKLSSKLDSIIEFKYEHLVPLLAGTEYDSEEGGRLARASTVKRGIPNHEKWTTIQQQDPKDPSKMVSVKRVKSTPSVRPDNNGRMWHVDSNDVPVRKATAKDYVRPTDKFAKAKTRLVLAKNAKKLERSLQGVEDQDEIAKIHKKHLDDARVESGESFRGDRVLGKKQMHQIHSEEMGKIRKDMAEKAIEGRLIVQHHKRVTGKALEHGSNEAKNIVAQKRADLDTLVAHHKAKHEAARGQALADVENRVTEGLKKQFEAEGKPVTEEHLARSTKNYVDTLKGPSHNIDLDKHYGNLAAVLHPENPTEGINKIRELHKKIESHGASASASGAAHFRREAAKKGLMYDEQHLGAAKKAILGEAAKVKATVRASKSFPLLKKAGIGAGVLAIGGAYAAKRNRDKKEQEFSLKSGLILFGRKIKLTNYAKEIVKKAEQAESKATQTTEAKKVGKNYRWIEPTHEKGAQAMTYESHGIYHEPSKPKEGSVTPRLLVLPKAEQKKTFARGQRAVGAMDALFRAPKEISGPERAAIALRAMSQRATKGKAIVRDLDIAAITKDHDRFNELASWARKNNVPVGDDIHHHRKLVVSKLKNISASARAHAAASSEKGVQDAIASANDKASRAEKTLRQVIDDSKEANQKIEAAKIEGHAKGVESMQQKLNDNIEHYKNKAAADVAGERAHAKKVQDKLNSKHKKQLVVGAASAGVAGGVVGRETKQDKDKNKIRQFSARREDSTKSSLAMGGSSALTGAILGGATAALDKKTPLKSVLKKAGIGAGVAGAVGLGGAMIGNAIYGAPKKNDPTAYTKRGAVGGAIGGAGLFAGGVIAAKNLNRNLPLVGNLAARLRLAAKDNRLASLIHKTSTPVAAGLAGAVGAAAGGHNGADEGMGVDAVRNLTRKGIRMSSKLKATKFNSPDEVWNNHGLTGKVSMDRFKKKIEDADKQERDANLLRAIGAGSLAGALIPSKMGLSKKIAVGAGAGAGLSLGVRAATNRTKDIYGERSHDAKKVNKLPAYALLGAAGVLGYKKAKTMFSNKAKLIKFEEDPEALYEAQKAERKLMRKGEGIFANWRRGKRLARDVVASAKGEKVLDARGREKTKEWDRPWARNAARVAILAGTVKGISAIKRTAESTAVNSGLRKIYEHVQSGALKSATKEAVKAHVPGAKYAADKLRKFRGQAKSEMAGVAEMGGLAKAVDNFVNKYSKGAPVKRVVKSDVPAGEGNIARKLLNKMKPKELSSKLDQIISFGEASYDDNWEDWLRNRPGVAKRSRRGKRLHEKEENKKVINQAKMAGALVLGTAIGATFKKPANSVVHGIPESLVKKTVASA